MEMGEGEHGGDGQRCPSCNKAFTNRKSTESLYLPGRRMTDNWGLISTPEEQTHLLLSKKTPAGPGSSAEGV
jgi:hypothetical protein